MLIDSHCHLDRLEISVEEALQNAKNNDVNYFLCVCIDLDNFTKVLTIAETYQNIFASVGVHPTEKILEEPTAEKLITLAQHAKVIALGETGLDYFHQDTTPELQQERLRNHILAAKQVNKPLIIHTRQARQDTIAILKNEKADEVGGVMHCFTEDYEMAKQAMDLNFYISFSGIVTFKNAKELQEVAQKIPLDRMLIETDAPYLAPVPYRGKSNQPAYVKYVAEYIAQLRGVSTEEIAEATTENFSKLFKCNLKN